MTTLSLTPDERTAVRRVGGVAYMGLVEAVTRRGRAYLPLRTFVYRTEERAQAELDALNILPSALVTRREVVLVDATERQEV